MRIGLRFDEYDLRARISPAVIVTLPALVAVFTFTNVARTVIGAALVTGIEGAFVLLLLTIARDRGKRIEARLYTKWGGKPTMAILRHCDARLDPFTKERYKRTLSSLSGLSFPNQEQESADPVRADHLYESAVKALIEKRRGKTYRLVFSENCNFGFVRNLLGLKPIGLFISVLTVASVGFLIWRRWGNIPDSWYIPGVAGIAV